MGRVGRSSSSKCRTGQTGVDNRPPIPPHHTSPEYNILYDPGLAAVVVVAAAELYYA